MKEILTQLYDKFSHRKNARANEKLTGARAPCATEICELTARAKPYLRISLRKAKQRENKVIPQNFIAAWVKGKCSLQLREWTALGEFLKNQTEYV